MGLLETLFANIENVRGQIKRRGLLDVPNIMGEHVAQNIAGPGLLAAEHARSVVPEVREPARQKMMDTGMGLLGAIKAYHGSPHKFEKFSLDKIGTGEGAQAYGHGLYFAENPAVAADYKKRLAGKIDQDAYWAGVPLPQALTKAEWDELLTLGQKLRKQHNLPEKEMSRWRQLKDKENAYSEAVRRNEPKGEMYEVSLRWPDAAREAADPLGPQHFLDWDKPLSQQPESVRKVLDRAVHKAVRKELTTGADTGGEGYAALQALTPDFMAGGRGAAQASEILKRKGIPGIRYLDGGSRGAGSGTSNYVLFDDALVEILKRNGVVP